MLFYHDLAEQNGGYKKIQNQVRLFMVPGTQVEGQGRIPEEAAASLHLAPDPMENWGRPFHSKGLPRPDAKTIS